MPRQNALSLIKSIKKKPGNYSVLSNRTNSISSTMKKYLMICTKLKCIFTIDLIAILSDTDKIGRAHV